jgi:cysteine sulfinate desulfinase/cysteine desulfurase-like protein
MGSIRFSLGRFNAEEEVEFLLRILSAIVEELHAMAA